MHTNKAMAKRILVTLRFIKFTSLFFQDIKKIHLSLLRYQRTNLVNSDSQLIPPFMTIINKLDFSRAFTFFSFYHIPPPFTSLIAKFE